MDTISFLTRLSDATGTDIATTRLLVKGLSDVISSSLAMGNKVVIPGLGEFSTTVAPQYTQEDIITGRMMCMPKTLQTTFSASATLKKRL